MRLLIAFAIAAAIPVSISSQQPRLPDPGGLGSFAIGHTWLVVTDTRPDPSDDTVRGTRPISVNVWYPVDATDVIGRTPDGLYPFERNTTPPSFLPTISADWERPCDNLVPPPPSDLLCEPAATHHPPTYEGVLPSALGPFPLVVFSTGWGNRALAYAYFAQRLASHGFVIAVSEHPRDRTTTRPPLPDIPRDAYYVAMYNRPRDVSFILDTLLAMNDEPGSLLHNSMKPDQVAAAGHSIGGYTSLTMAGGDNEVCLNEDSVQPLPTPCVPITDQLGNAVAMLPDPRIKAIVTLDAVNRSLRFGELARITIPSMSIGESYDAPGWPTFLGARQHAAIPAEFNYRVDIPGAVHQSFESSCTGIWVAYRYGLSNVTSVRSQLNQPWCATALPQREVNRLSAKYAIAFLKTHLAGEPGHQRMLTPGWALTRESNVEFFVAEPSDAPVVPDTFLYFAYQPGSTWFLARSGPNVITAATETTVR